MLNHATILTQTVINKLKKILQITLLVIGLISCQGQEVNGIWMSYNNYVIDIDSAYTSGNEGILIDFDKGTIGAIFTDTIASIKIDFKQSKVFVETDTLSIDFKVHGKDSIEIDFGQNMMHVFRPLNLNHKLDFDEKTVKNFLIENNFDKINGSIDIEFSDKFFFRDELFEKRIKKNAVINKTWEDEGYWIVKEIRNNFFLLFTLDQTSDQNIYQILSLDNCKMELFQLQEAKFGKAKLTELKTCL